MEAANVSPFDRPNTMRRFGAVECGLSTARKDVRLRLPFFLLGGETGPLGADALALIER